MVFLGSLTLEEQTGFFFFPHAALVLKGVEGHFTFL